MTIHLFDGHCRQHFLPFTYTRTVADIRLGILTIREKWEQLHKCATRSITADYLQELFPAELSDDMLIVSADVVPTSEVVAWCATAQLGEGLYAGEKLLAARVSSEHEFMQAHFASKTEVRGVDHIAAVWDIFAGNDKFLCDDFKFITEGRSSAALSESNTVIGDRIFVEDGATVEASILNSTAGPIYIGKGAEVMEGCMIRGSFALCEGAVLKMGTKIYGATTLGPGCKAGGELNNVVFFANSSKAHDGFLGNAVVGEWCNLGADTNCSNLKNNYEEVKLWSEHEARFVKTGLQFCGLMMADHSKCGINTMFNTGTVVGVSCNIFGAGFPRNVVPSFAWGGAAGMMDYRLDKALQTMKAVYTRRAKLLTEPEMRMYAKVFELTSSTRNF
jgi:UDP-N-acetylglucosamine diphosphorylase/glucosamine-1-phosphate N-acetyltransferase